MAFVHATECIFGAADRQLASQYGHRQLAGRLRMTQTYPHVRDLTEIRPQSQAGARLLCDVLGR